MTDGFLGRWAQRKQETLAVKALPEAQTKDDETTKPHVASSASTIPPIDSAKSAAVKRAEADVQEATLPNMSDVLNLTTESNFAPFVARNVSPEVRNAAMKKLFTDPHYKVMDRLDIYIDDYSKPDPLPLAMLRQLASAQFLNLFDDEEKKENADSERKKTESAAKFENQEADLKCDVTITAQDIPHQKNT